MKKILSYIILFSIIWSCKNDEIKSVATPLVQGEVSDECCVKQPSYNKGDVRRYGIFPNKKINASYLKQCLELADQGLPLYWPQGKYDTSIILEGVTNVRLDFDNVVLTGSFQIINKDSVQSKNIKVSGDITILDKLFIRSSKRIDFDNVYVFSDTINNFYKKKNRGVSIYFGSKDINFKTLEIKETGGSASNFFKYTAAAFQVHGWNNNPEKINIKYLKIKDVARSALYLTGNNHKIERVEIENFGFGSDENMFGLEDAEPEAQKLFSGAWFNKCNDCTIDTLIIKANKDNKTYSARFDLGVYSKPCIINNIKLNSNAKKMPIEDDVLTNVLVKKVLKDD